MTNRVRRLSVFVLLFGAFIFCTAYCVVLYQKHNNFTYQTTDQELNQIQNEIKRLEKQSQKGYENKGE